jgi:hypothetical protein
MLRSSSASLEQKNAASRSFFRVASKLSIGVTCRITPQISDALMRVTQNTFMAGARSLHLLVIRLHHARKNSQTLLRS